MLHRRTICGLFFFTAKPSMSSTAFSKLGLIAPLLQAVAKQGYETPSPIQAQAIPVVLQGHDLMAAAQTGTGKTAGFTLPLLQRLSEGEPPRDHQVRALILTPTRELAAQVANSVETYSRHLSIRSTVAFGGVNINPQLRKLRRGTDILVATPGRLLDLYRKKAMRFDQLEILVMDEADRMLDMGFIHDIREILKLLPKDRQNLLFSATFSKDVRQLAQTFIHDPVEVSVAAANSTADTVEQRVYPVDKKRKADLLTHLIQDKHWHQVLVFTRTKHGADTLTRQLTKADIRASAIHGNKSQGARTKALDKFKKGSITVLVATDIAARGLDIQKLPHVVNYDLPNVPEDYVHRIGRTGRAGEDGVAVSLVSADEAKLLFAIEKLISKPIEREYQPGFEPDHDVPADSKSKGQSGKPGKPSNRKATRKTSGSGRRSESSNTRKDTKPGKRKPRRSDQKTRSDARRDDAPNKNRRQKTSEKQDVDNAFDQPRKRTKKTEHRKGNAKPATGNRKPKPGSSKGPSKNRSQRSGTRKPS